MVVCIDDIDRLDPVSLGVLVQVSKNKTTLLACTVTDNSSASEGVTALMRDGAVHRIQVSRLSEPHLAGICAAWFPQPIAHTSALALARLACGQVTTLRELLSGALEEGVLRNRHGIWYSDDRLPVRRLTELMRPRLAEIGPPHRAALELVSLVGSLSYETALVLAECSTWEALEASGLVETSSSSDGLLVTPVDDMVTQGLVATLPTLRRHRLLRSLLDAQSADVGTKSISTLQSALWRRELGLPVSDQHLVAAAHQAWWSYQWSVAEDLLRQAWGCSKDASVAELLDQILWAQEKVDDEIEKATSRPHPSQRSSWFARETYDSSAAVKAAQLLEEGACAAAWRLVEPVVSFDEDARRVVDAGSVALTALLRMGRPRTCVELGPRLLRMLDELRASRTAMPDASAITVLLAYARGACGERSGAILELRALMDVASGTHNAVLAARAGTMLALLLFEDGNVREAHRILAGGSARVAGPFRDMAQWGLAVTAAHLGDVEALRKASVDAASRQTDRQLALALREHHEGDTEAAVTRLVTSTKAAIASGAFGDAAKAVHLLGRLDRARVGSELCGTWTTSLEGPSDLLGVSFTQGTAKGAIERVQAAAEGFESAGTALYAAEAWAVCSRLHRKAGQARHATAATRRCSAARANYDGRPPVLLHVVENSETLTRREREIALMAAGGHTDQAIAELLVLSVRTVSNHLYSIYRKLGVSNRRALKGHFDQQGS
nr:LuxR family transcriptional regulator [Streptomyces chartreusis]